ncbi:hypothetical protein [Streptomyces griseus]|uniref:hypothetical protein n=1 Tax=Streptomyces griseus TaxID=1911 RepID=UPI003687A292
MIISSDRAGEPSALPAGDLGGVPVVEAGRVDAEFAEAPGTLVQRRWVETAARVRLEHLAPVAAFPVVPGRRWGPGWWWSATTGRHVMHGSQAMCAADGSGP